MAGMRVVALRRRVGAVLVAAAALRFGGATATAQEAFALSVPTVAHAPHVTGVIDDTWSTAAQAPIAYDFTNQRAASDASTVYIAADHDALDVAFVVKQRETVTSTQETNGAGVLSDDHVTVVLYPQGTQGIAYTFSANPVGARYQTSTENSAYTPQWSAVGRRTADGYVVTMRIPRDIIRSGNATSWKAQFERTTVATSSIQVWEHQPGQRYAEDPTFAGTLNGIAIAGGAAPPRPKPRLQLYALGELTGPANGGSTSRSGADLALPVTATSSLLATVHPDYSNVEVDQQTISPSAYARLYYEVRPFFTQSASNFNYRYSCSNCPTTLYTPAIPQFRDGYAYSGTAGPFTFGAFDAIGYKRTDSAQTLNYIVSNTRSTYSVSAQRVAVDTPYLHDDTTSVSAGYGDQRTHAFAYVNYAQDRGNFITDPSQANYVEYGVGYASRQTFAVVEAQKLGAQFLPADGYVQQPDVAGVFGAYSHTFNFPKTSKLLDIFVNGYLGRYHDHLGNLAQTDGGYQVNFDLRNLVTLHVFQNSTGVETFTGEFLPFNTNGLFLGYRVQSATPSSVSFSSGPFYHGYLGSWSYATTLPVRRNVHVGFEIDENRYASYRSAEPGATQWLERASVNWQINRLASLDIGARRILGRNLPNAFQGAGLSNGRPCGTRNGFSPFDCVDAGNASIALHVLRAHDEFYFVYGDPNSLATKTAMFVKWIHYIGAQKGT